MAAILHFQIHFLERKFSNSHKKFTKFVPNSPINNILASVQIMAWRRPGDTPFSEPMMIRLLRLLTHLCVTRPQ